jgi:hypothetical protein
MPASVASIEPSLEPAPATFGCSQSVGSCHAPVGTYVPRFLALVRMTELGSQRSAVLGVQRARAEAADADAACGVSSTATKRAHGRTGSVSPPASSRARPPRRPKLASRWSLTEDATIEVSLCAERLWRDSVPRDPDDGVRTSVKVAF